MPSSLALSFFYFCLSSILIQRIFEIRSHILYMLCTSLLLFNFQRSFRLAPLSRRATLLLYHFPSSLSIPFLNFFKKFFQGSSILSLAVSPTPSRSEPVYYTTARSFCQALFYTFSPFSSFLVPSTIPMRHFIRLFGRKVYILHNSFVPSHKYSLLFL